MKDETKIKFAILLGITLAVLNLMTFTYLMTHDSIVEQRKGTR